MIIKKNITIIFSFFFSTLINAKYHSQVGQDRFLNQNFFHNRQNLTFVDIGAYDGIMISNSYFFEKELNWNGICIEPLPDVYQNLKQNRNCICLNCCVSSINGYVKFAKIQAANMNNSNSLSGILRTYENLDNINDFLNKWNSKLEKLEILDIQSRRLNDILNENKIKKIDYLSIDTEGAELDILRSIDYKHFDISFMTIENNFKIPQIKNFLSSNGFRKLTTLEQDEVYINKKLIKKFDFNKIFIPKKGINNESVTLLINAIYNNDIKEIKTLLKNKININAKTKSGMTALHYAIKLKKVNAIKILIQNNANLNALDVNGKKPIESTNSKKIIKLVTFLKMKYQKT